MNVAEFDFELPDEAIAQHPAPRRDASRLLVLERHGGAVQHRRFSDLPALLDPGDLVVVNDVRVIPARLSGRKPSGGRVELLLVEREGAPGALETWRCLVRASRAPMAGSELALDAGLVAKMIERDGEGWRVELRAPAGPVARAVAEAGRMPLPPYIHRKEGEAVAQDAERYQTIYARHPGAVAAPTAGLHFSVDVLDALARRGIELASLTLHVGPGTFRPVRTRQVEEHRMDAERFVLPPGTARAVDRARERGGRVVAVGTTVVRTLEERAAADGRVNAGEGRSELFIYPGFRFRVVDALVTNFHLPRSTLIMLAAAFAGRAPLLAAYREALERGYRFFSYGDAMLVRSAGRSR